MPTATRGLAFDFLLRSSGRGPHVADWLASSGPSALPPRDAAFLRELLLGVLRRRGEIDHVIEGLSARPLAELTPAVLAALRLGAYQLIHMRVPHHAAVAESVELARAAAPRAAPFVNAVLRRLAREGPPAGPDPGRSPRAWLEWQGSLPPWLAERWMRSLGSERAVRRARAFLEIPPAYVRLNPRHDDAPDRCKAQGIVLAETLVPGAYRVESGNVRELMETGRVHVQDLGSQAVAHLAAGPGLTLDACAAPGGKTTLVADLGGNRAHIIAAEVSSRRVASLGRLVKRWGSESVSVVRADLRHPPFGVLFDTVLLDAPCSGLGTLARNPDVRWRVGEADIARHAERQSQLLSSAARLVRPGGRLVYSVCSLEPEEASAQIETFLDAHAGWHPATLPAWAQGIGAELALELVPEDNLGDGFFAVLLRRSASDTL